MPKILQMVDFRSTIMNIQDMYMYMCNVHVPVTQYIYLFIILF